jgi:hypothetical protein
MIRIINVSLNAAWTRPTENACQGEFDAREAGGYGLAGLLADGPALGRKHGRQMGRDSS